MTTTNNEPQQPATVLDINPQAKAAQATLEQILIWTWQNVISASVWLRKMIMIPSHVCAKWI